MKTEVKNCEMLHDEETPCKREKGLSDKGWELGLAKDMKIMNLKIRKRWIQMAGNGRQNMCR